MTDRRYEVPDLIPQLRKQNAELMAELKVSREIQAEEKKILLDEIEARAEMRKERDELAAALAHNGHAWLCPAKTMGSESGPCDCGVGNAKAILAAHDADVVHCTLVEQNRLDSAMNALTDTSDNPEVQDAIDSELERMEVEARARRKTEDSALVKPLLGILERFLPWIEGVNHVHLPGGSVLYSEEVASTLAAYRKTEASLTDAETYECHCGCGYVGTLAAYRKTEVEP